jgi:predicted nuclease of predicted toxin-antitoxin system
MIWTYAAERGYLLVSKDTDFFERSALYGAPPKVVWLRLGNAPMSATSSLLRDNYIVVRRFHDDPDSTLLALPQR